MAKLVRSVFYMSTLPSSNYIFDTRGYPYLTIGGQRLTNKTIVEYKSALNDGFTADRYISLRDHAQHQPPEYLEEGLCNAFKEDAACFSIACYNAAATMLRLCVDLVTRPGRICGT